MAFALKKNIGSVRNNFCWQHFLEIIENLNTKSGLFLEVGGGDDPERVEAMSGVFKQLIELERKPVNPGPLKVIQADAQYLPFKQATFDGVIALHVMEHLKDDALFLREVCRVLKTGGFAVLIVPNRLRLPEALRSLFCGERVFPYLEHIREYTRNDLADLITGLPFCQKEIGTSFFGLWGGPLPFVIGLRNCPAFLEKYSHFLYLKLKK